MISCEQLSMLLFAVCSNILKMVVLKEKTKKKIYFWIIGVQINRVE